MPAFDYANPPERLRLLVVETTTLCSLKCAGCLRTRSEAIGNWTDRHMSAARFQRVVDNFPPADVICVQGIGEPTLNPEFVDIVAIAKRSGKFGQITFSTHGLARSLSYYRELLDAGLSQFRVSVDSLDPQTAERLRSGTDVEKLRRRIAQFAEQKLPFGITITVSKLNVDQLPDTLAVLDQIAQDHRFVVGMHNFIYNEYEENAGAPEYASWVLDSADFQRVQGHLPEWKTRFANLNIDYAPYFYGEGTGDTGVCDAPWQEPWVGVDGMWGLCCFYPHPGVMGHINVETMPFDQAWRSVKAQHVLRNYSGESPSFCDRCPRNCGRLSYGTDRPRAIA